MLNLIEVLEVKNIWMQIALQSIYACYHGITKDQRQIDQQLPILTLTSCSMTATYSASVGALGGVSSTCTPPLFAWPESLKGNFQPPSLSGVASQSLMRCLLGLPVISA